MGRTEIGFNHFGIALHVSRHTLSDFLAVIHHAHLIGNGHNQFHIVFDEKNGQVALIAQFANEMHHLIGFVGVHASSGFIQQEKRGLRRQSATNLQTTLKAIGKIFGQIIAHTSQTDKFQEFERVRQLRANRLRQLRDIPSANADRAFATALYGAHPYGHLPIGTAEALGEPAVPVLTFPAAPPRQLDVDPAALQAVRDGLYEATHDANGTSSGVFGSFPVPIAGKTGTAEKVVQIPGYPPGYMESQAWWCGWGPFDGGEYVRPNGVTRPPLVVCAVIENGGHGGAVAAPTALKVFEYWFRERAGAQGVVASD